MILTELYQKVPQGFQELEQDNSQITAKDLRKTRLTLFQINKLRQMNDLRQYEQKEKIKKIKAQYAPAPQPLA